MGDSSPEIDKQIKETREHLDENLLMLERRAASGARRVARIAVIAGIGLAATAGIGFAVYRLRRRRSALGRIHDAVPRSIRRSSRNVLKRLRRPLPTVEVVIAGPDKSRTPSVWRSAAEKIATTVAVSAATAMTSRIVRPREKTSAARAE